MVDLEQMAREHLARIYADLSRPDAFPEKPETVEIEETHISIVFLAGDVVYKVKKPVDFGFLDFSTLEKREFYCREELRLNQRLTHEVYLDVVPIRDVGGHLSLHGDGPIEEYAVKMRRLPDDAILGNLIDRNQAGEEAISRVAARLADFYQVAETGPGVDEWGTAQAVGFNIEENVDQSRPYIDRFIAPTQLSLIDEASRAFLEQEAELFRKRVEGGKIREGHGDLHLKHICIEGPEPDQLQIIDCVEFNPRIRCLDVATDIAFLAMDLDYRKRPELAEHLVGRMTELTRDPDLPRLVQFFKAYRAHVRAKVACFLSDDMAPELPDFVAVRSEIESYIDLATSYLVTTRRPLLLVVGGLSGTGKSVLARRLARILGGAHISSDIVRKEMSGHEPATPLAAPYGAGIYESSVTADTYQALIDRGREIIESGQSAILDATFLDEHWRGRARDAVELLDCDLLFVECACPPDIVLQRLEQRITSADQASDADKAIYQRQRERYGDTMVQLRDMSHMVVETDRPSALALDEVLRRIDLVYRFSQ
jgi:uncharacterized protein